MPGRKLPRKRGREREMAREKTQMKLEKEKVLKLSRFSRSKEKINALLPIVKHISFRNQAGKWSNFQVGLTTQDMHPREIRKSSPDFTQLASRFFPDIFYVTNTDRRETRIFCDYRPRFPHDDSVHVCISKVCCSTILG